MNISSEETYLPLHNAFMKQCYLFLLLTNGIQMILHLYAFYFWYNCQNSFLKAPLCIIYAHLMMVDCHSGSLTKCFSILCYISERLLIHMQPMWLVLCPDTRYLFLSCYPDIPKRISKVFFFSLPNPPNYCPKGFLSLDELQFSPLAFETCFSK